VHAAAPVAVTMAVKFEGGDIACHSFDFELAADCADAIPSIFVERAYLHRFVTYKMESRQLLEQDN